jgi:hypothetical protein
MKKQQYTILPGFGGEFSSYAHIEMDRDEFKIMRDSEFGKLANNPLKTTNGFTVGQRNRAFLHTLLDAWIDNSEVHDSLTATEEQCARFNTGSLEERARLIKLLTTLHDIEACTSDPEGLK